MSSMYVWFDAEYTDLDLDKAALMQVAVIITDERFKRLLPMERDFSAFVALKDSDPVSPWVSEHLADIVAHCRTPKALSVDEVDQAVARLVKEALEAGGYAGEGKKKPVLAGNSVHADWYLMRRYLPQFHELLHYRHLDVTAFKLLWLDWYHGPKFEKEDGALLRRYLPENFTLPLAAMHDAYYDIHASMAEMNYYLRQLKRTTI